MKKVLLMLSAVFLTSAAMATTFTWDGGDFYSSSLDHRYNWTNNEAPTSDINNTDIVFTGWWDTRPKVTSNISVNSVAFDQAARQFTLGGNKTLTIGSGGILQQSLNPQYITAKINLGANQVWNTYNHSLSVSGKISGSNGLEKTGSGTLYLSGQHTYTGPTTITEGTISLHTQQAFANNMPLVMNGGALRINGYSQSMGTLTLTADSTIDFGNPSCGCNGSTSTTFLRFANSSNTNWTDGTTLYITNWDGKWNGNGQERLYVGNSASGLNANQLSQIKFYNPNDLTGIYDARILTTGEIVPVPEPATMALGGALAGLLGINERRRRKAKADQNDQA